MKKLAIFSGATLAAATGVLVLGIIAAGKGASPGFLGPGVLLADLNLVLEIALVLGLTLGFFLARAGNIEAHRLNQTVWVLVNAALVTFIMASSMREVKLASMADLAGARYWISWLHALVGSCTVAAGLWLVLQMNDILPRRFHVAWWKNLMRLTLAGYWAVAVLGFLTYYFWYAA
jgi:uncharacterized membrane protein YozB (DUF420 family)